MSDHTSKPSIVTARKPHHCHWCGERITKHHGGRSRPSPCWASLTMLDIHVIPVNDEKPHSESVSCPCKPMRDVECNRVIIHNAWDRREIIEQIESKTP
jgi:hypothetical protein